MEMDLPSNSQSKKTPKAEPKKIEKVIEGEVVVRKKPLGRRFLETFNGDDSKTVAEHVVFNVLIPSAKDMIFEMFQQGLSRKLWGEARASNRGFGFQPPANGFTQLTNYANRYTQVGPIGGSKTTDPRVSAKPGRKGPEVGLFVFPTRVDAVGVLDRMYDVLNQYDSVSVNDLYEMIGHTGTHIDVKWGWTNLKGAGVASVPGGGYSLDLPRPVPLD